MREMMTENEVAEFCNCSQATISRWERSGKMPKPTKLPGQPKSWPRAVIERWRAEAYSEPDEETTRRGTMAVTQLADHLRSGRMSVAQARAAFEVSLKADVASRLAQHGAGVEELVLRCVANGSTRGLSKVEPAELRDDLRRLTKHYIVSFQGLCTAMSESTTDEQFKASYVQQTICELQQRGATRGDVLTIAINSFTNEVHRVLKNEPEATLRMTKERLDAFGSPEVDEDVGTMFAALPSVAQAKLKPAFDAYCDYMVAIQETFESGD